MIQDLPSNSLGLGNPNPNRSSPPPNEVPKQAGRPEVKKVVTGKVTQQKKSMTSRLIKLFSFNISEVADKVVTEVLIPKGRDLISDAFDSAKNQIIYKGTAAANRSRSGGGFVNVGNNRVPYHNNFSSPNAGRPVPTGRRASNSFENLVLEHRGDAENILEQMWDIANEYGEVSLRALYEMTGQAAHNVDEDYGWNQQTLQSANIRTLPHGGYLLELPHPQKL